MDTATTTTMTDEQIAAMWQQQAMELLARVRSAVNLPSWIGTDDETGVVLMFFNTRNHRGKSTLVATETSARDLRLLLRTAAVKLSQARIVEPEKPQ